MDPQILQQLQNAYSINPAFLRPVYDAINRGNAAELAELTERARAHMQAHGGNIFGFLGGVIGNEEGIRPLRPLVQAQIPRLNVQLQDIPLDVVNPLDAILGNMQDIPIEEGPAAQMPLGQPRVDPQTGIIIDEFGEGIANAEQIVENVLRREFRIRGRDIFNPEFINQQVANRIANDAAYQQLPNQAEQQGYVDHLRILMARQLSEIMGVPQNEAERQLLGMANGAIRMGVRTAGRTSAAAMGGAIGGAIGGRYGRVYGGEAGAVAGSASGTALGVGLGIRYGGNIAEGLQQRAEVQLMRSGISQQSAKAALLGVTGLWYTYSNAELLKGIIYASAYLGSEAKQILVNFIYGVEAAQFDPMARGTDITDYSKTVFGTKYLNGKTFMPTQKSGKATYKKNNRDQMVSAVMKEQKRINSLKLKNIPDPTLADIQAQRIEVANREIPNFNCLTIQKEALYHPYPVWDAPTHLQNKIYRTVERTQEEKGLFHEAAAYLPLERHGTHRTNLGNY